MSKEHPGERDAYSALSSAITSLDKHRQWERDNRIALLWVHAEIGIVAGMLMLVFGTANVFSAWWGEEQARLITGLPALLGGIILAIGLVQRPRAIPIEIVGVGMMALWDLGMSLGLGWALRNSPPGIHSIPYPVVIYGGYFQILLVHLYTLCTRNRLDRL